jgi:bifunctional non-homologous end joining protein LigD
LANDLPTLVWVANLASIELHTSLSRAPHLQRPTTLVFDLDPGPPATIVDCCQVALWLRELFARHGMECFPKTSGSKGMQLYAPLNRPDVTYDDTKGVARGIAELMQRQHPDRVTSVMKKAVRPGKVFIDWSQNDAYKTTINVYSMRAKDRPTVSTPITWDEVEETLTARDPVRLRFETDAVLERIERVGDLFAPVSTLKQRLPADKKLARVATPRGRGGFGRRGTQARKPTAEERAL